MRVHMSRPASLVIRLKRAEYAQECSGGGRRAGRRPNGTYNTDVRDGIISDGGMDYLHPVGLICEYFDDQLLICGFPSSHLTVIVDKGLDIFGNVVHLPILAVEGDRTKS